MNQYESASSIILLVEDNAMDVDLTLRAFKQCHLANQIIVARDGQEVLDWIPRWDAGELRPNVILLDLQLPKMNGLEVLTALKAHPVYRTTPVVVLTSSGQRQDIQRAYEVGANSYIVKPVDFEKFVQIVQQIKSYWMVINEPSFPQF